MSDLFTPTTEDLRTKALYIDEKLRDYYGGPFIFFSTKDALSEMVSAMLSHRTKNAVSGAAYRSLRAQFPTWEEVMHAPLAEVEEAIKVVTYPEVKAPRIQNALRYVKDNNGGVLNLDFVKDMSVKAARKWVEKMPGIGIKTSAAILNFSHLRLPALVVDMHHLRVGQRLGLVPAKCTLDKGARLLESYLPEDWDGQRVYDSHQGFMRLGQKVCHWRKPNCSECVVSANCDYYNKTGEFSG